MVTVMMVIVRNYGGLYNNVSEVYTLLLQGGLYITEGVHRLDLQAS